ESGISIYDAIRGASGNYPAVGKYLKEIIKQVDLGTSMEDAINQAVEKTPSEDLRKILWQLLNSLKTGADSAKSLRTVIEQIVKEQQIAIVEYGRKLNPMAMFYMMIAIIIPTLGVTMLIILSMIMGLPIDFKILLVIV
ncbi:MAG: type II secretion system F family protein, partial [Candidatus Micrarchaeia archaeon]